MRSGRWATHRHLPPPHAGLEKPDLVARFLGAGCFSASERTLRSRAAARAVLSRHDTDVGSTEVQVADLTERIRCLSGHLQANRQDFHSRLGLTKMIERRKKHLKYLHRTDFPKYEYLIVKLGIKDRPFAEPKYESRSASLSQAGSSGRKRR